MLTTYYNQYKPLIVEGKGLLQMIDIFSSGTGTRTITLEQESVLKYMFIATGKCEVNITIQTTASHSNAIIRGLCLATDDSDIKVSMNADLQHNSSTANIHLVSFIAEGGKCVLDGKATIHENTIQCVGHLLEENILLGKQVQIRTLPMLDVRSSDVKATHGATIQRLDEEKLFYLSSKGIPSHEAKRLMISSYFQNIFALFSEDGGALGVKEKYLTYLLDNL